MRLTDSSGSESLSSGMGTPVARSSDSSLLPFISDTMVDGLEGTGTAAAGTREVLARRAVGEE